VRLTNVRALIRPNAKPQNVMHHFKTTIPFMKRLTLLTLTFATLLLCCNSPTITQQNWVQNILNNYKDSLSSYGMVALVDNGSTMDTASIGVSFDTIRISTKNRFCIGSCTKMYTATLILKLHEKGLLNINDSIYHYIPHHKFIDSTITIRQLLNHTSGLTDFTKNGFINAPLFEPYADYSDTYIFSLLDTVEFEKGSQYRYCNTNYFLLRQIIENVTDRQYTTALREFIFEPLELKNTFPYYSNQIEFLAHPIINGEDLQEIPKIGCNAISNGAGNIVSDIYDVNKFVRALLLDKTILKPATLSLMSEFYQYKNNKVGLGLFEETYGNRTVCGHTGRQVSYISYAFADTKTGKSFIILTNNANDIYADKLIEKICDRK
jgi:D-alanyl-D-alanine carboxypeptidase